jgi:hypothetical protein
MAFLWGLVTCVPFHVPTSSVVIIYWGAITVIGDIFWLSDSWGQLRDTTYTFRIWYNIPSPSHMRGPNVYRPSFSSNGLPVSPNRSCLTGRCSLCVKSPPSSNQLSKPGLQTRCVFNSIPYSEITSTFLWRTEAWNTNCGKEETQQRCRDYRNLM